MLTPLLHAPAELQIHVAAAILSLVLAPVQAVRRRRDRAHRFVGYTWVTAMAVTAISSFWLLDFRVIGPFSPIHALSLFVLFGLGHAIHAIRRGDVAMHRQVTGNLLWGLGIAGLLALMPGRLMNEVLFSSAPVEGFMSVLGFAIVLIALYRVWTARPGSGRQSR